MGAVTIRYTLTTTPEEKRRLEADSNWSPSAVDRLGCPCACKLDISVTGTGEINALRTTAESNTAETLKDDVSLRQRPHRQSDYPNRCRSVIPLSLCLWTWMTSYFQHIWTVVVSTDTSLPSSFQRSVILASRETIVLDKNYCVAR